MAEEVEVLHTRIDSLEQSRREALSLVESKTAAYDELKTDLALHREKNNDQRRQISNLEQKLKDLETASTTSKFSHTRALQEVEQLQNFNRQLSDEIKAKIAESTKLRQEYNAQSIQARQQIESLGSTVSFFQASDASLKKRIEELTQKVEDGLDHIQRLSEQSAREQEQARAELASTTRLAELHENAYTDAKNRIRDLEQTLVQMQDQESHEITVQRQAMQAEKSEREAAGTKIAELEQHIEKLEAEGAVTPAIPATPLSIKAPGNGLTTPSRSHGLFSGLFTPSSSRIRTGNMSMTQLYSEYSSNRAELEKERQKSTKLRESLDGLIRDLESKEPEITEMQQEHQRLQAQVLEMNSFLNTVSSERDEARRDARLWHGEIAGSTRQLELLQRQVRDLNHQLLVLTAQIEVRDQGADPLAPAEQLLLERLAKDEFENGLMSDLTGIDQTIRKRLTIYRNVRELQEQNNSLRQLAREYEMKAEGPEIKARLEEAQTEREQLQSLKIRMSRYQDEIRSLITKSQSFVKERDMFRRMLEHRGQTPSEADRSTMFGESTGAMTPRTPSRASMMAGIEQTPGTRDSRDYSIMLNELQSRYDAYKEEVSNDRKILKDQVDNIARERSELQTQLSGSQSNLSLASDRYQMLQSNVELFKSENDELRKRMQALNEINYKQEIRTQQAAEDLVEARALMDTMRTELSNARAEKSFFKSIETRLQQDNENLQNERIRVNELVTSLQNLQNDRELADSESRRRLESKIEEQHQELNDLRRKLELEVAGAQKVIQQSELERHHHQTKMDELTRLLSSAREELTSAHSMRDGLQTELDQMSVELRTAREKLEMIPPQSSPQKHGMEGGGLPNGVNQSNEEPVLAIEMAEIKLELDVSRRETSSAREDAEQYKAMCQEMEEELRNLTQTQELYRADVEKIIQEKEAMIAELNETRDTITRELGSAAADNLAMRERGSEEAEQVRLENRALQTQLEKLNEDSDRLSTMVDYLRQDLRAQAEIAQAAQNNYEQAIVNHGLATDAVLKLRSEYNSVKIEAMEFKSEVDTSREAREIVVSNWKVKEQAYEKEILELRERQQSADAQTRILAEQVEIYGNQVQAFKQARRNSSKDQDSEAVHNDESSAEGLQEVIRYLRREKEIVDTQHEIAAQESTRLKQQLSLVQTQLDQMKLQLEQERMRSTEENVSSAAHRELMDKLTELNLYRESNTTLRAEAKDAQDKLLQAATKIEELETSMQPLHIQIRQLEVARDVEQGELNLLRDDRDRWRERTQAVMQKHESIDPEELEALRTEVASLQTERDAAKLEQQNVQDANTTLRERQNKLVTETKDRLRTIRETLNQKTEELGIANGKLASADEALQLAQANAAEANDRLTEQQIELEELRTTAAPLTEKSVEGGQNHDQPGQDALVSAQAMAEALQSRVETIETQISLKDRMIEELRQQSEVYQQQAFTLESSLAERVSELERLEEQSASAAASSSTDSAELTARIEDLQNELSESKQLVEDFKSRMTTMPTEISPDIPIAGSDNESAPSGDLTELKQTLERQHMEHMAALDARLETRTQKMRQQLMEKLKSGKEEAKVQYEKETLESLETLRQEHHLVLEQLRQSHLQELETLRAAAEARVADGQVASGPVDPSSFTDTQVREFLKTNTTAQQILRTNIQNSVAKGKEAVQKTMKEEFDQKIADMQKKADQFREQTAKMNDSRQELLKRQLGTLRSQVGVVSKAATETPQKPVVAVWEVAKNAKPPPAPTPVAVAATPNAAQTAAPNGSQPGTPVQVSNFTVSTQQAQSPIFAVQSGNQALLPAKPQMAQNSSRGGSLSGGASGLPRGRGGQIPRGAHRGRGASAQQPSGAQTAQVPHPNPTATEPNPQPQSQLPRGGGGGGIPRGRQSSSAGRGANRGAANVKASADAGARPGSWQAGSASPLSAAAPQFVPANGAAGGVGVKRGREPDGWDEPVAGPQGGAKRARSVGPGKEN